ncbi:unnamed protein product [Rhizophagus irregularis]|nr:unnamed protein product [Rhizophagus irregularis]
MQLKTKRIHRIGIVQDSDSYFTYINQSITLFYVFLLYRYLKEKTIWNGLSESEHLDFGMDFSDSNNQSFDVPFPSVLEDTSKSDDQILDDYDYGPFKIIDNYDNDNSETESGTSEEYDGFEEFEITAEKENKIWDDKLIQGLRLLHVKVLHSISDEAFNKISNQLEQCSKPLTKKRF